MCEAYRLIFRIVEVVGVCVDSVTGDLVGPSTVVPNATRDGLDITPRHGNRLSVVERLDGSQEVGVLVNEVGESGKQNTPLLGRNSLPFTVEGLPRRRYRQVDILLGGLVDGADDLLGGGVDDLEGLLVNTRYKLIVDKPGDGHELEATETERRGVTPTGK